MAAGSTRHIEPLLPAATVAQGAAFPAYLNILRQRQKPIPARAVRRATFLTIPAVAPPFPLTALRPRAKGLRRTGRRAWPTYEPAYVDLFTEPALQTDTASRIRWTTAQSTAGAKLTVPGASGSTDWRVDQPWANYDVLAQIDAAPTGFALVWSAGGAFVQAVADAATGLVRIQNTGSGNDRYFRMPFTGYWRFQLAGTTMTVRWSPDAATWRTLDVSSYPATVIQGAAAVLTIQSPGASNVLVEGVAVWQTTLATAPLALPQGFPNGTYPDWNAWGPQAAPPRRPSAAALPNRRALVRFPVPAQVLAPPAFPPVNSRPRVKATMLRRGRIFDVPVSQVVAALLAYVPQPVRAKVKPAALRRGRIVDVPVAAAAVAVSPPYPPQNLRSRAKTALLRRGRVWEPAWPQSVDVVVTPDPHGLQPRPSQRQVSSVGGIELVQVREPRKLDVASGPAATEWIGLVGALVLTPTVPLGPTRAEIAAQRAAAQRAWLAAHPPLVLDGDRAATSTAGIEGAFALSMQAGTDCMVEVSGAAGELWLMPGTQPDEDIPPFVLDILFGGY